MPKGRSLWGGGGLRAGFSAQSKKRTPEASNRGCRSEGEKRTTGKPGPRGGEKCGAEGKPCGVREGGAKDGDETDPFLITR